MSIAITLHYRCGGCDASKDRDATIQREFRSFSGRSYGFGGYHYSQAHALVEQTTPEDWVAFDPYTNVTYCGKCWEEIMSNESDPPK